MSLGTVGAGAWLLLLLPLLEAFTAGVEVAEVEGGSLLEASATAGEAAEVDVGVGADGDGADEVPRGEVIPEDEAEGAEEEVEVGGAVGVAALEAAPPGGDEGVVLGTEAEAEVVLEGVGPAPVEVVGVEVGVPRGEVIDEVDGVGLAGRAGRGLKARGSSGPPFLGGPSLRLIAIYG